MVFLRTHTKKGVSVKGFTLVELMCVLAILAILNSIGATIFSSYRSNAVSFNTKVDIQLLEKEINDYFIQHGTYPESLSDIGHGNMLDYWGNPYQYTRIAGEDENQKGSSNVKNPKGVRKDRNLHPINTDYDLYSMGEDGKTALPLTAKASRDDIIRANDGAYLGYAYLY